MSLDSLVATSRNMILFLALLLATFLGWSLFVWIFGTSGAIVVIENNSKATIENVRLLVGEEDVEELDDPLLPGESARLDVDPEEGRTVGLEFSINGRDCKWRGGFVQNLGETYRMLVEDCSMVRFRFGDAGP